MRNWGRSRGCLAEIWGATERRARDEVEENVWRNMMRIKGLLGIKNKGGEV